MLFGVVVVVSGDVLHNSSKWLWYDRKNINISQHLEELRKHPLGEIWFSGVFLHFDFLRNNIGCHRNGILFVCFSPFYALLSIFSENKIKNTDFYILIVFGFFFWVNEIIIKDFLQKIVKILAKEKTQKEIKREMHTR